MRSLLVGKYIYGQSVLHRLDPRVKLFLLLSIVTLIFIGDSVLFQFSTMLFLAFLTYISDIPSNAFKSLFRTAGVFVLLTLMVHIVFAPEGGVKWKIFFIMISQQGVKNGIFYSSRLFSMIWLASLLAWTTTPIAFTDATLWLLKPLARFKVPVRDFSMMMLLALRFVPTLLDDVRELKLAQLSRGASLGKGSPIKRIKSVIPLVVPLFVGAFRRAENTAVALTLRGYRNNSERTSLYPLRFQTSDYLILGISCVIIAGLVFLMVSGQ